ncbi:MAG TPA: hypothetical protein VFK37_10060 [Bacillales bacterium]|nr:hypothetical protein [Bacillales bacterium]
MMKQQLEEMLATDREDLMAVLMMRFGPVPDDIVKEIEAINSTETLERLILAAANVPNWETFVSELREGQGAFKLTGDLYDPLSAGNKKGGV